MQFPADLSLICKWKEMMHAGSLEEAPVFCQNFLHCSEKMLYFPSKKGGRLKDFYGLVQAVSTCHTPEVWSIT